MGAVGAVGGWTVVVPVKELAVAKTRLSRFAGASRPELALAFALDTVAAALTCPLVGSVLVVTDDARVATHAWALGAGVTADVPRGGQNPAIAHGARVSQEERGPGPVAALSADLPALRQEDLTAALAAAGTSPVCFVADVEGTGTTLLAAADGSALVPAFGHRSRARHTAAGAVELTLPLVTLRRDVDTEVDLYDAQRLGVGPRTAAVLAELGDAPAAG